jgi:hypothetical protein
MLQVLDEELEKFMIKMWRYLIFMTEASKLSLLD